MKTFTRNLVVDHARGPSADYRKPTPEDPDGAGRPGFIRLVGVQGDPPLTIDVGVDSAADVEGVTHGLPVGLVLTAQAPPERPMAEQDHP